MSNVKKYEYFCFFKIFIRNLSPKKSNGFLLFEFVVTLGMVAISLMSLSRLLFIAIQTQQMVLVQCDLINNMANRSVRSYKQDETGTGRVHFVFDDAALGAWHERWQGRSGLCALPLELPIYEVELRS